MTTTPRPTQHATTSSRIADGTSEHEYASSEYVAYQLLRLAAEHPGTCGRLRMARIIGNYAVPFHDDADAEQYASYRTDLGWPLRELTRLVDALITGGLLAQSVGPRPVVCITRAGCRTLEALAIDLPAR